MFKASMAAAAVLSLSMIGGETEYRYCGGFNQRGPDPEQPATYGGKGRLNPHRGGRRYSGGRYKGSTAAKRATRRGGNPARQA